LAKAGTVSPTLMSGTRISPLIVGGVGGDTGAVGEPPPPQPVSVEATVAPVVTRRHAASTSRSGPKR
jgi:hypothetical protein